MSKNGFAPLRHTLIARNLDEECINGTVTPSDIDGARRLARSILLLLNDAATIEIYTYVLDVSYRQLQPLQTVSLDDEADA